MGDAAHGIIVFATGWCPYCHRARRTLDEVGVPYTWIDIDEAPDAARRVMEINHGDRTVPTIVFPGGRTLTAPGRRALLAALRLDGYAMDERAAVSSLARIVARLFRRPAA